MSDSVPNINSSRPFHRMADAWLEAGHLPVPLTPGDKTLIEGTSGLTGKKNPYPEDRAALVDSYRNDTRKAPSNANIALWLGPNVIGIDIDDYTKDEKTYKGWGEYLALAEKYGKLPPTWVTTARTDGRSGIRYYRIPDEYVDWAKRNSTLAWPGKAASNIDVIHRGYRYAAVHPSIHPGTKSPYESYDPELWESFLRESFDPRQIDRSKHAQIFSPDDLPFLPEPWIDFLTRGKVHFSDQPINVDLTADEVFDWYKGITPGGKPCKQVKKTVKKYVDQIKTHSESHPVLTNAHWAVANLGIEGHSGAMAGIKHLDKVYYEVLSKREKRPPSVVKREIFRSEVEAMRKARGKVDELKAEGINWVSSSCTCVDMNLFETDGSSDLTSSIVLAAAGDRRGGKSADEPKGPQDFPRNHRGNAFYMDYLYGENIKWVWDMKRFMLWDGSKWTLDNDGHTLTKAAFDVIRQNQTRYAEELERRAAGLMEVVTEVRAEGRKNDGSIGAAVAEQDAAQKLANKWATWATQNGMDQNVSSSINLWKANEKNAINSNILNADPLLLGMKNGVLELGNGTVRLRKSKREDYITVATNVDYVQGGWEELQRKGGDTLKGVVMWKQYLNKFIPDEELRSFIQKLLGYSLLGDNRERLLVFFFGTTSTGKTVMVDALQSALGEYWADFPMSIFNDADEKKPMLLNLRNKRVITTDEVGVAQGMDEATAKRLAGDASNSGRYLNSSETHTFHMKALPIIATNNPPSVPHADAGLARRLCVIPFNHQTGTEGAHIKNEMLAVAKEAILVWLVEGYIRYSVEGISRETWPESVTSATVDFTDELSDFGRFFKDHLIRVDYDDTTEDTVRDTSLSADQIHRAYEKWCERMKEDVKSKFWLGRKMTGFGINNQQGKYFDGKNSRRFRGVTFLKNDDNQVINFKGGTTK